MIACSHTKLKGILLDDVDQDSPYWPAWQWSLNRAKRIIPFIDWSGVYLLVYSEPIDTTAAFVNVLGKDHQEIYLNVPRVRQAKVLGLQRAYLEDIFLHELAHVAAYKIYGTIKHDYKWRKVAKLLGAYPRASSALSDRAESYVARKLKTASYRAMTKGYNLVVTRK